jgi:hypothetical protein
MIAANIKIIDELKTFVTHVKEKKLFFSNDKDFTKERKLPFERLVYLLMNMPKKSLSIELNEFFETIQQGDQCCSKAAFSQQRMKLQYDFFAWWNVVLANSFYAHYGEKVKRWRGYRLMAVDGSTAYLINKQEIKEYFGIQDNQSVSVVMGRIVSIYDVLNEMTISSHLLPITCSEQEMVNQFIPCYDSDVLAIYDRGYPSFTSIYLHLAQERPSKFVMRCRTNFNKEVVNFMQSREASCIVYFKASIRSVIDLLKHGYIINRTESIKVRLIKVKLDNGTIEVLITNLYSQEIYPSALFKELYFKRWGAETNYNMQKNILQLESFSGQKVNNIMQDFYATVFIGNLQSIISKQCDKQLIAKTKHRKYDYKVNRNVAIGMMKNRVVHLFLTKTPEHLLMELEKIFLDHLESIRPNRAYNRIVKNKRANGKYQTLTNYKRAI